MDDTANDTASEQAATAFDYDGTMLRLGGDPSLFANLVAFFLEDIDGLLTRLRSAIDRQSVGDAEIAAHSIKGLCANFGAAESVAAAYAIEHEAQSESRVCSTDALERLVRSVAELKTALATHPTATPD